MTPTQTAQTAKLVFGYCRVSTDKQADKGVSLEAQAEKIRAMAVVQGVELADIIVDAGESAKSLQRPGMARLLALVDAGQVRTVIVAKLDRLTRSVKDLGELLERFQKRGVSLVSVAESLDTGSAAGRLVMNIMASVSQWEREAIGERTSTALQHKKSQGKVYGSTPYGYERIGDALVPLEAEQAVVGRIRFFHANSYSLRRIASALNADGIPTKQGRQWAPQTVSDVLTQSLHSMEAVA
jgi:DNA invertase Pin-like site-specific DNA recombinase